MRKLSLVLTIAVSVTTLGAEQSSREPGYLTPPRAVVDILDARPTPAALVGPSRQVVALLERTGMPTVSDLAQMVRLAGIRLNPNTNGPWRPSTTRGLTLKRIADGAEVKVATPAGRRIGDVMFSPDGKRLAFTVTMPTGIELHAADVADGRARRISDAPINAAFPDPCEWLASSDALLCRVIPAGRGPVPSAPPVPKGPNVQENDGRPAPVRTYEDLLETAHDDQLFEHYFTSQLALYAVDGRRTSVGKPGIYELSHMSPSGQYVVVARITRPFSRLVPADDFAKDVEVWTARGELVRKIADLPLAEHVPINGVPTGPRRYAWKPTDPATLVWVEALDEGNPKSKVPHRDRVATLAAPFEGSPTELAKTEYRFQNLAWTERGLGLLSENDRPRRWTRTWILDRAAAPRLLWDRSTEDRYKDPGSPLERPGPSGVVLQTGDSIYLAGAGASPQGDRPFLDRVDLRTGATERLFRTDERSYETVVGLLSDDGRTILTRHETRTDPPNYFVRATGGEPRALTSFTDPTPQLRGVERQLLTYARKDGVRLSATLYLPPGYKQGERLPVVAWAYPREFTDPAAAGQVVGAPNRFLSISGPSHMLFLTQGYAVLDNPTMPIVGKGETANDTYVDQLVASAQAAVDKIVEMGVADRERIGVGGHSYGAFMTANLLAHSDIFRAGIARSGAYNRTLTPFGFQNEQRTFWEVPDVYARMSPFWFAHKVNEPVLLTHGEADDNSGTFPIQSERFFMALKGHGATVRYVTLPNEPHGYTGRESVLHTVAEMLNWFEKYVKHAKPRGTTDSAAR